MTAFVSRHTEYDNFLYAVVVETEDLPLTVVSMLTRLNLDAWLEAARLSQLPRQEAIESLSASIQRSQCRSIPQPGADELAARLLERLPTREALVVQAMRQETLDFSSMWLIFAIFFSMMALSQTTQTPHKHASAQKVALQKSEPSFLQHDGVRKEGSGSMPPLRVHDK